MEKTLIEPSDTTTNPIVLAITTLGCSQSELAKRIGVSPSLINMWKRRGYVTTKYLKTASKVTGIPAYLLNPYVPNPNA